MLKGHDINSTYSLRTGLPIFCLYLLLVHYVSTKSAFGDLGTYNLSVTEIFYLNVALALFNTGKPPLALLLLQ